ncbi:MAG: alanine racemase [Terriglobia bacterium]|jgi:D-serine deaminase-like pyridoxal phosphate-dependent protein
MLARELSTPALTVDLDALERNLNRGAELCRRQGVGLRPHTKTHKTVEVARLQLAHGAVGLTVAKVGEAEVMAGAGLDDILVAFPILGEEKLRRLARLARARRLLLSLDSEAAAQELSRAAAAQKASIGVLVEFDAGARRCGLDPGPALVALAKTIEKLPGLKFRGLMSFFGNVWGIPEQRRAEAERVAERVARGLAAFRAERMPVEIVSGGSTPSAEFAHLVPGLTEIRPGTYVYNDLNTYYQGACRLEDCAVRVVATVVSTAVPGRAIIDAGSKTFSSDPLGSGPKSGYGYVVEAPDAPIIKLNEEHGHLDITQSRHNFHVGEVVTVIPNHVCATVNMHDEILTLRQGEAVGCWKIAARGKVR